MARIFSTEIYFNQHTYHAVVTVTSQDQRVKYTVRLLDDVLRNFIPEGVLTYDEEEGFSTAGQSRRNGPLLKAISDAIRLHVAS